MSLAIGLNPLKPDPIPVYPFTAIVGQEKMKLGLLLTLIHPRIGGLLIRGQRGTAKSTAVRGLIPSSRPWNWWPIAPFAVRPEIRKGCAIFAGNGWLKGKPFPASPSLMGWSTSRWGPRKTG